ncbi:MULTISPECIES: hypothetical protein [unclassified Ensifer]|uniref:hypothetical protein n=1 Tax=unclassified Ensifer TaxID=2633371 RepID=UPI000812EEE2|nr:MULTISPECIES: hypothetical protein [unclassified Ensifer]OCP01205.1 hypothetical protein BC362_22405 [Ensifer sp. LC14]OCP03293.1 hypothetical protein BBX50_05525 [Ensifer sp. LC11]OCP03467.1 hypothetical protein BC374_05585 [Ensifer sp. LC13]OCP33880.1 hypothetical protein BC364_13075 [Ensifer sp. LC499]
MPTHRPALLALILLMSSAGAKAEDANVVPPQATFVTSTGYWEESGEPLSALDPSTATAPAEKQEAARRGYYKLIALRQTDGTAQIHLQQIEATATGPVVVSSAELEEFTALKAYVTDIRPETSTGVTAQSGMFATVYLKTDPSAREPETWTVLIDDLGDIKIERASN